jgi:hypothetical protein
VVEYVFNMGKALVPSQTHTHTHTHKVYPLILFIKFTEHFIAEELGLRAY